MFFKLIRKARIVNITYKRNSFSLIFPTVNTFSTNHNNNKRMEDTPIEHKIQQLKIQNAAPKTEENKTAEKTEEPTEEKQQKVNTKKQKNKKQQKPKVQKKQEAVQEQVGPKLFSLVDIRVSQIVECWKHPQSQNLYCQKILVNGQVREIASGLQKFVPIELMKGKVLVMANLKPRPLAGFQSNGMVVCASNADHTAVELLIPQGQNGERVYLQGFQELFTQGDILPVLNPKKKILQKVLEHFSTDAEGHVVWKGIRVRTQAGYIISSIKSGHVA